MARPRSDGDENVVSLFPFLSILACVIGALTLMITAMALGQLDPQAVEEAEREVREAEARQEKFEQVNNQLEQQQQELAELKRLIAEAERIRKELAAAREELKRLETKQAEMQSADAEAVQMLARIQELRQAIESMNQQLPDLKKQIEQLKQQIAEREKPPEEAVVEVQPGGTGVGLEPTFVECRKEGIVIYEDDQQIRIGRDQVTSDERFIDLLDRIAKNPEATVVFLIRDDARHTYFRARNVARSRYARQGKLPLVGHGKLDLSKFEDLKK